MDHDEEELRPLAVDLRELEEAFESGWEGVQYYLDIQTGDVVMTLQEERDCAEEVLLEWPSEAEPSEEALLEAIEGLELENSEPDGVLQAIFVERGLGDRFRDMEAFIDTVEDERFQDLLLRAIHGRGAFRRFKDTLCEEPAERERWFAFGPERKRERLMWWLESLGIRIVERG
ncbi:MAG: hypothetical protein HYU66_03770 [Armatimonadetes bacterium]|nr:hypothetical protein [Armatimonadota bacterium]